VGSRTYQRIASVALLSFRHCARRARFPGGRDDLVAFERTHARTRSGPWRLDHRMVLLKPAGVFRWFDSFASLRLDLTSSGSVLCTCNSGTCSCVCVADLQLQVVRVKSMSTTCESSVDYLSSSQNTQSSRDFRSSECC
jgi:hypothetical protein